MTNSVKTIEKGKLLNSFKVNRQDKSDIVRSSVSRNCLLGLSLEALGIGAIPEVVQVSCNSPQEINP